jgi:hypothetical protein
VGVIGVVVKVVEGGAVGGGVVKMIRVARIIESAGMMTGT